MCSTYLWQGQEMNGIRKWQGYLIQSDGDSHLISSPWKLNNLCVFGFDSDYTTLAISLLRYLSIENSTLSLSSIDEVIDEQALQASVDLCLEPSGYQIKCNNDASLHIFLSNQGNFTQPDEAMEQIDQELYETITVAWQDESNIMNTSQGAYVSGQQYDGTLESRLSLVAQNHHGMIWPPRQMDSKGENIGESLIKIEPYGSVTSWTRLSAAGAPSEFAIRAPILGGISTVMVRTNDGPNGVFLLVDDQNMSPQIGDSVEIVVRRLYAQEGITRYGAKAMIVNRS